MVIHAQLHGTSECTNMEELLPLAVQTRDSTAAPWETPALLPGQVQVVPLVKLAVLPPLIAPSLHNVEMAIVTLEKLVKQTIAVMEFPTTH